MEKIAVLSGKGGVGKSSIAAALAVELAKKTNVVAVDCDVDASNLALVLGLETNSFKEWKKISTNEKAVLLEEKCVSCKKCINQCYFGAISWNEKEKKPVFDGFACEGCGTCVIACPEKAIKLEKVDNAAIGFGETEYGFKVVSAQLEMGESGSGKVVAEAKKLAEKEGKKAEIMVVDSAAGIGCPVIASIAGCSYAIAVTEPTPSGLSDLERALAVVEHFGIPYGIIINKHDLNPEMTAKIEKIAAESNIAVLGKIPYDKRFVESLVEMKPVSVFAKEYEKFFKELGEKALKELKN